VTGRLELGASSGGMPLGPLDARVGPLAVGAGAVWVGTHEAAREGPVTARIDPVRLRVTARFGGYAVAVAHGVLWSYCCLRGGQIRGFGRVDARTLRARPPLLVKDAAGRPQPIGWFAVGTDAVWTAAFEDHRVWRVPLAGGPAHAVVWVAGPYARGLDGGGILLRVDPVSGRVAGWLRDPRWSFQEVLAAGPRGAWVTTAAPELLHVIAA
jgi:hypothetical protein